MAACEECNDTGIRHAHNAPSKCKKCGAGCCGFELVGADAVCVCGDATPALAVEVPCGVCGLCAVTTICGSSYCRWCGVACSPNASREEGEFEHHHPFECYWRVAWDESLREVR